MNANKPKVVKFGGSSLADANQIRKVYDIIMAEPDRRYVVASAPGKRFSDDIKITDLLYKCFELSENDEPIDDIFDLICNRFNGIIEELGLDLDISDKLASIKNAIENHAGRDYAASRGEYLNSIILAKFLGFHFLDAARVVKFRDDGTFDAEATQELLSKKLSEHHRAVVPGFYGSMPNGTIKTFSRGGSDVTGSLVARASDAYIYENWTDVSGFMMADPRIVDSPMPIDVITYRELRELSCMGAGVFHEDAVFPVRIAGIPINIKNTNAPEDTGTFIVPKADSFNKDRIITGISGKKGFSTINIEKDMLHNERGIGRKILEAVEKENMITEHLPSGIDTISVVISGNIDDTKKQRLLDTLEKNVQPDSMTFEDGFAIIAVVGRGMVKAKGTAARIFKACAENDINIRMIDQGSSELNIIIGVMEEDFEKAIKAIYNEFVPCK